MKVIILGGGEGKRLRPWTEIIPKPLLPVNGKPILGIILNKLKRQGITDIILAVNDDISYLFKMLFEDGSSYGMNISYSIESKPLGTAGPIKLAENALKENFFVMNGDLVTDINPFDVKRVHEEGNADITIVTKEIETNIDFGIIDSDGKIVKGIREKPVITSEVNTGMYIIKPSVLHDIPENEFFHMTHLIERVIQRGGKVLKYPYNGEWVDIGLKKDYEAINGKPAD